MKVTERHIKLGRRHDPQCCPVALALKEQFSWVSVTIDEIIAYKGEKWHYFIPNRKVVDFIVAFDSGKTIEPMEFEL
jgi:hypothetical protein